MSYYIFFSEQSTDSMNLLGILKKHNLINEFKLVCLEKNRQKFPSNIRTFPTMVINGKHLEGKQAFEYVLYRVKKQKQQSTLPLPPHPPNNYHKQSTLPPPPSSNNKEKVNFIFYSKNDQDSNNLIGMIKRMKLLNEFQLVSQEDNPRTFPCTIKILPTLIIHNIQKPLSGKQAFEYLKQMKHLKKGSSNKSGLLGYVEFEHNSKSDLYTFIEDDKPAFDQQYVNLNKEIQDIITEEEGNALNQYEQTNEIRKIKKNRENQENDIKEIAEKQQIAMYIKAEEDRILNEFRK